MLDLEIVHSEPLPGQSVSGCCGRTLAEMAPQDWLSRDQAQVTCGRLTPADEFLLLGTKYESEYESEQQESEQRDSEQLVFEMAVAVQTLCGPLVTLQGAYNEVRAAIIEMVPVRQQTECWSPELMVRTMSRAAERVRR